MIEREPRRNSLRLPGYDYASAGYYFVTICTYQRQTLFKNFVGADLCVRPSPDNIPLRWLWKLEQKYTVHVDIYAILPDHVHMILVIPGGHTGPPLPEMIKWYKTQTTNAMIRSVQAGQLPQFSKHIWQRGYYDHIIRNDEDLESTRQYIRNNPIKRLLNQCQDDSVL